MKQENSIKFISFPRRFIRVSRDFVAETRQLNSAHANHVIRGRKAFIDLEVNAISPGYMFARLDSAEFFFFLLFRRVDQEADQPFSFLFLLLFPPISFSFTSLVVVVLGITLDLKRRSLFLDTMFTSAVHEFAPS